MADSSSGDGWLRFLGLRRIFRVYMAGGLVKFCFVPRVPDEKAPPAPSGTWLVHSALVLTVLFYLGLAGFHVAFGAVNVDEGFYAVAARAVWEGEVPYRDFGFTQTPLVCYVNGVAMGLTRFGLFEQRIVNGGWALLALLLGVRLVTRRGGLPQGVLFLTMFALTPAWLYFVHLGKTYGLLGLVVMAAVTVFMDWAPGWKRAVGLSVLAVIGVGCRLPSAPFFGLLWLWALAEGGFAFRRAGVAVAALGFTAAGLLLPFHLLAPEQARFWVVDFHRISVPLRDWRVGWEQIVALSPAVWGLLVAGVVVGLSARRPRPLRELGVVLAAMVALAVNLLPSGAYEEYGIPFLPPLAVAALRLLQPVLTGWSRVRLGLLAVGLLLLPLVIIPALFWRHREPEQRAFPQLWVPLHTRPYNFELPGNVRRAREAVAARLPPGQPFYGAAVILAVEAGRPVPRRLRMGAFTVTADYPPETADRLHLMTYPELIMDMRRPEVTVFGLHGQAVFNYAWSVPSFRYQAAEERRHLTLASDRYFHPAYLDGDFVVMVRR